MSPDRDAARAGRPLHWSLEADHLAETTLAGLATAASSGRAPLQAAGPLPGPAFSAEQLGGPVRPPWSPTSMRALEVCRVAGAYALPGFGAVFDDAGRLFASTVAEAQTGAGGFGVLPGVDVDGEGWRFTPPSDALRLARAAIFLPWGARFNYGHFLLDALPSLLALERAGLLAGRPVLTPPLSPWQRRLLALAFGPAALTLHPTPAPVVEVGDIAFASSMDHFLNGPNLILRDLRERIQARAPAMAGPRAPSRLYLSRRSHAHSMRIMVNEAALEQALRRRGFAIVRPEALSPARQAMLMREAEVVVGPTGAAMANAALCPPGARIVEIQPETFTTNWVHAFSTILGQHWSGYFAPAPLPEREVPLPRRLRRGFRFGYRLPLQDFLAFLDAEL